MRKKKKMLTIFGIIFILLICFFASLYMLGVRSDVYKFALEFIDDNKLILENVGTLESRRLALFGYSVRVRGSHGHAEYKILVKGEKGKGAVYLELEKSAGIWKVIQGNLVSEKGNAVLLVRTREKGNVH